MESRFFELSISQTSSQYMTFSLGLRDVFVSFPRVIWRFWLSCAPDIFSCVTKIFSCAPKINYRCAHRNLDLVTQVHHKCGSRKIHTSHGRFFGLKSPHFTFKNLAFEIPPPSEFPNDLPWCGYGYFLGLHNNYTLSHTLLNLGPVQTPYFT